MVSARPAAPTSKVWYTLNNGELSEIYYPRIDTPSTRDTQLVVTDGRTFTDRESTDTIHQVRLLDPQSLSYQQIDTAKSGKYVITKTYVTDPGVPRCSLTSSSAPLPGSATRSTSCTTPP